jgi:cytochrome c oxidase subunit IV
MAENPRESVYRYPDLKEIIGCGCIGIITALLVHFIWGFAPLVYANPVFLALCMLFFVTFIIGITFTFLRIVIPTFLDEGAMS